MSDYIIAFLLSLCLNIVVLFYCHPSYYFNSGLRDVYHMRLNIVHKKAVKISDKQIKSKKKSILSRQDKAKQIIKTKSFVKKKSLKRNLRKEKTIRSNDKIKLNKIEHIENAHKNMLLSSNKLKTFDDRQIRSNSEIKHIENVQKNVLLPSNKLKTSDDSLISRPMAVNKIIPDYPKSSRIDGEEGAVKISADIRVDGSAGNIKIESSSGFKSLDDSALKAVRNARFIPAHKNGRKVEFKKVFLFRFILEDW